MYLEARSRLFEGDPTPPLREALTFAYPTPAGRDAALQVLDEFDMTRPDVVLALVPQLLELALGLDYRSGKVRQMIARLEPAASEKALTPIVVGFLEDGSREAADYWGLIELLDKVGLVKMRKKVIAAAACSADEDTRITARQWNEQLKNRD
ncbi:hypothetical protein [Actinoplanes sp. L3-i22]|uniref:hypothetical protein n=1 Tax=Actinoplanes sp. L3-i22 TaxID=2836373 RepID=UPI001C788BE6|nr:hypothetical protein [Actinoplanes sp. L3-i22]BCY13635.1 hypothetical protein L3i22_087230 [Actinoplanes sp. L3-i22]